MQHSLAYLIGDVITWLTRETQIYNLALSQIQFDTDFVVDICNVVLYMCLLFAYLNGAVHAYMLCGNLHAYHLKDDNITLLLK